MVKLYLPVQHKENIALPLKHEPTGRETIIVIPGASSMDGSQLREIIQWQTEKFMEESQTMGAKPKRVYSRKEVGKALNEFRKQTLKRQQSTHNKIFF